MHLHFFLPRQRARQTRLLNEDLFETAAQFLCRLLIRRRQTTITLSYARNSLFDPLQRPDIAIETLWISVETADQFLLIACLVIAYAVSLCF